MDLGQKFLNDNNCKLNKDWDDDNIYLNNLKSQFLYSDGIYYLELKLMKAKYYVFEVQKKWRIVEEFYLREGEMWHKLIHKCGGTIEENIKDTLASISDASKMYVVNVDGKLAAYFVWHKTPKDELVLEGFHVMAEYRNREFLTEFWEIVKDKFNGPILTGIYCKNEPALRSLLKAGFRVINMIEEDNSVFIILKCD